MTSEEGERQRQQQQSTGGVASNDEKEKDGDSSNDGGAVEDRKGLGDAATGDRKKDGGDDIDALADAVGRVRVADNDDDAAAAAAEEEEDDIPEWIRTAAEWIASSNNILVVSGAGVRYVYPRSYVYYTLILMAYRATNILSNVVEGSELAI